MTKYSTKEKLEAVIANETNARYNLASDRLASSRSID
jgi:hypothetical protein